MKHPIRIRREILERLQAEARRQPAVECCGLLAGRAGVITTLYPATNVLASATRYEIAPEELFCLFRRMRAEGLELLGIYHSHPSGENFPSTLDIERAYYPEAAYFILSPVPEVVRPVRAFRICDGQVQELSIEPV
ncbi:MAG: M67 family metallopeptidase [Firmicutes bacterium]|nr:M67 family metallopeptidase [Bacillota bacterium]